MNVEEKYQAEQIQSDKDHHTPTAGAMISHILSNLFVHRVKLRQANYYLKGSVRGFAEPRLAAMIAEEDQLFDELSQKVLDEGELVPTTLEEFTNYAMIKDSGKLKYEDAETILNELVADLATQNLFITRGIALAEKEEKFGLAEFLKKLYAWIKHQLLIWQRYLGNDVNDGLEEDDE
ncbi:ferritin-like domain-containing protein [Enterococcus dongliensis]|uniref:ferritin-like domain-containing protein n=1 Tax=Enterococcus dongliensis TaxID=2559925 RepID=UPI00289224FB|nr:ferritin-like domain-containing protein [Enterococcus dongliensis]MDT2612894.1 ferritin-like domain-containing protein [Enterococcus dongliensis]